MAPAARPESLPSGVSPKRTRRALIRLGALIVVGAVVVTLLPGLGELRSRFAHARPIWLVVACALEVLSVVAYVPAFRAVFCTRMSWGASYKIAVAEEGAGSLFPFGGAGSLALGVWALRRAGMPAAEVARKSVGFFLLTSVVPVATLVLVGVGLATGVLPGHASVLLTVLPAAVAVGAIVGAVALGRLSLRIETRVRGRTDGSRLARLAPALRAAGDGVDEALRLLRRGNPLLWFGLVGYLVFDILVLWASFRAVGSAPELTIVWAGYLIGQLGNWLPVPGGIGGVEGGLIGILILYGLQGVTATAAVLLYRVIELWIPAVLGAIAFVQLRALLRRESDAIDVCQPGDVVEIVGVGPVIAEHSWLDEPRQATTAKLHRMASVTNEIDPSVPPSGSGCAECLAGASPGWWLHLRRCAACGHIGCCDNSPSQHATAHYKATGHPVLQSFEPGEEWFYDYRSGGFFEAPPLSPPDSHPADQPVPGPAGAVPSDWELHLN